MYIKGKPAVAFSQFLSQLSIIQLPDGTYTGIDRSGIRKYALDSSLRVLHRDNDEPACIYSDPIRWHCWQEWYKNGLQHRDGDKPAKVGPGEYRAWYKHGVMHRIGGPAEIYKGTEIWCEDGEYHRVDGPAVVCPIYTGWFIRGKLHRDGGPARINRGYDSSEVTCEEWYNHGKRHRIGGPAEILFHPNVEKYYINDKLYSKEAYEKILKFDNNEDNETIASVDTMFD